MLLIPTNSNYPDWTETVQIEDRSYRIRGSWDTRLQSWRLDIGTEDEWICQGAKAVANCPIWHKRKHDDLPAGRFFLLDQSGAGEDPGRDDLGDRVVLLYVPEDEFPADSSTDDELVIEVVGMIIS